MNKTKRIVKIVLPILILAMICFGIWLYENYFAKILVIPGKQAIYTFTKGSGSQIIEIENKEVGLQAGDIIIAINGEYMDASTTVDKVIEKCQDFENDTIIITYVRENEVYETTLKKGESLQIKEYNFNNVENGYVAMIDPNTYEYALNNRYRELGGIDTLFTGMAIEAELHFFSNKDAEMYSLGNVIGSIVNCSEKGMYGFIEPFNYDKKNLVEIARKYQVKDGPAILEVKDSQKYNNIKVNLKCTKNRIELELQEFYEDSLESFKYINISGMPIYQDGKLVGVYVIHTDETHAYAWYAIDVYKEMKEKLKNY